MAERKSCKLKARGSIPLAGKSFCGSLLVGPPLSLFAPFRRLFDRSTILFRLLLLRMREVITKRSLIKTAYINRRWLSYVVKFTRLVDLATIKNQK